MSALPRETAGAGNPGEAAGDVPSVVVLTEAGLLDDAAGYTMGVDAVTVQRQRTLQITQPAGMPDAISPFQLFCIEWGHLFPSATAVFIFQCGPLPSMWLANSSAADAFPLSDIGAAFSGHERCRYLNFCLFPAAAVKMRIVLSQTGEH